MDTILVLTDFSGAAYYGASYACVLAKQFNIPNIVLYHSYRSVVSPGESVEFSGDENSLHGVAEKSISELALSLADQVPEGCDLRYRTDTGLLKEINTVIREEGAELVVMGTVGKGKLEQMVAGSNSIEVCENSDCPVVLVPMGIPMQPVCNIIFAFDLKEVEDKIPQGAINHLLKTIDVPLSVIHVGDGEGGFNDRESTANRQLHEWLDSKQAVYHEVRNSDVAAGILDFASQASGSMVLLVARKHGFPAGLFHRSITKQLASASTVPLLVFREVEQVAILPEMPLLEI